MSITTTLLCGSARVCVRQARCFWKRTCGSTVRARYFIVRAIRYDTIRYFNVRSKADISQLNLPHDACSAVRSTALLSLLHGVYTLQPVVQSVVQPVAQLAAKCKRYVTLQRC